MWKNEHQASLWKRGQKYSEMIYYLGPSCSQGGERRVESTLDKGLFVGWFNSFDSSYPMHSDFSIGEQYPAFKHCGDQILNLCAIHLIYALLGLFLVLCSFISFGEWTRARGTGRHILWRIYGESNDFWVWFAWSIAGDEGALDEGGSVVEWLGCQTWNLAIPRKSPALTTSWICHSFDSSAALVHRLLVHLLLFRILNQEGLPVIV